MYIIGYSNGSFRRDDQNFTSGGQCESGLKMIIAIGETEFSTSDNRSGGDSSRHDPGPPLPPTQLAGIRRVGRGASMLPGSPSPLAIA